MLCQLAHIWVIDTIENSWSGGFLNVLFVHYIRFSVDDVCFLSLFFVSECLWSDILKRKQCSTLPLGLLFIKLIKVINTLILSWLWKWFNFHQILRLNTVETSTPKSLHRNLTKYVYVKEFMKNRFSIFINSNKAIA